MCAITMIASPWQKSPFLDHSFIFVSKTESRNPDENPNRAICQEVSSKTIFFNPHTLHSSGRVKKAVFSHLFFDFLFFFISRTYRKKGEKLGQRRNWKEEGGGEIPFNGGGKEEEEERKWNSPI